jgi:3-hydroxyisobutyrate dehydrogenase-like beta-hydroxyacid dehydrogenase
MIGFIGLGVMGEPMCRNLASKSGEQVLGLGYALELAGQAHVELRGAQNVKSALERAAAAGNGKKYFLVLVRTL